MFAYKILPRGRTSDYWCDGCDCREGDITLVRLQGFYRGTDIPVSYLFHTDLQTFKWSEPDCEDCSFRWTERFNGFLREKITSATIVLQRWARRMLYAPPNGKLYLKAKGRFEAGVSNSLGGVPDAPEAPEAP